MKTKHFKRLCLKCSEPFRPEGKYEKLCPVCFKSNRYETWKHTIFPLFPAKICEKCKKKFRGYKKSMFCKKCRVYPIERRLKTNV